MLSLQTPDKVVSQEEAKMLNVCVTLTGPIDFPFSFFLVIGYEEGTYVHVQVPVYIHHIIRYAFCLLCIQCSILY